MAQNVADQIAELLNSQNQLAVPYTAAKVLEHQDRYVVWLAPHSVVLGAVEVKKVQWYQCEIDHLSVRPEAKRQGIGTWLLKEAETRAKQMDARVAQCTIRLGNEASERLFKKHGHRPTVTFLNEQTGNPVIVYQKVFVPASVGREVDCAHLHRIAYETRNLEISLFWQRSNYFLVLNTAIAAGLIAVKDGRYAPILCGMGLFVSFLWVLVNAGSKFWQSRWERRLSRLETEIGVPVRLFSEDWPTIWKDATEGIDSSRHWLLGRPFDWLVLQKPSVSLSMFLLSFGFVVFWGVILTMVEYHLTS